MITDKKLAELMEENGIDDSLTDACKAYLDVMSLDDLDDFEEAYAGQFESDKAFTMDMVENLGLMDRIDQMDWPYRCIDWEMASRELMCDYTEQDGYYFRNL
jgi:antirestriction protein